MHTRHKLHAEAVFIYSCGSQWIINVYSARCFIRNFPSFFSLPSAHSTLLWSSRAAAAAQQRVRGQAEKFFSFEDEEEEKINIYYKSVSEMKIDDRIRD